MARSDTENQRARERARESILAAAVEVFGERGVDRATIAEITRRAGVAQGLVNYHFGTKDGLVDAVIDRWFEVLVGLTDGDPTRPADERLASVIDSALAAAVAHSPLQSFMLSIQQNPATRPVFAAGEARHARDVGLAEGVIRSIFRERGAEDPATEEIMLRSLLEGVIFKYLLFGEAYPLEGARRWVFRQYGVPEPTEALRIL